MQLDAIGQGEMQNDSVNSGEIVDGAVGQDELANDSVGSGELQNDSVGSGELRANSVGSSEIIDGSVGTNELQNSAVTAAKLAVDSVTASAIAPNSVGASEIINGSVGATQLGNGAVTDQKIANGAVTGSKIENASITTAKLVGGTSTAIVLQGTVPGAGINIDPIPAGFAQISVRFGTGTNEVARGNAPVPAHSHEFRGGTFNISGGLHAPAGSGNHIHSVTSRGFVGTSTSSTKKYKTSITDYEIDPKKILSLRLKQYKYLPLVDRVQRERNRDWMHGYIAEEVEEAGVSEIVVYDENHAPIALDYGLLSVLTVELLRAQQIELDSLKEEVQRLKDKK
jgi:hypothetical protein